MNGKLPAQMQFDYPNTSHFHRVVTKPLMDTIIANGVTFILKKGPRGKSMSSTWFSTFVQRGDFEAKFTNDGIFLKDDDFAKEASIGLIIKGLPAGTHDLSSYGNQ